MIVWPLDDRVHQIVSKLQGADPGTLQAIEAFLNEPLPVAVDGTDDWTQAQLAHKHPMILSLDRIITEVNETWAARMAHGMLNKETLVDQREIDFRRGWYQGARYALRVIPFRAHRRAMKALAESTEEVED